MRSSCMRMRTPVESGGGQAEVTGFLRMECLPDMLVFEDMVAVVGDLQFSVFRH